MSKFSKEFQEFILRGNVVDMAVGIVIGGAFGKIVTSLVNDVIMPPIGMLTAGINFSDLKIVLNRAVMEGAEIIKPEVALNYGAFLQTLIDFLIISFSIFLAIKGLNKLRRNKPAEEPAAPAEPSEDVKLLTEIRDLLKKN